MQIIHEHFSLTLISSNKKMLYWHINIKIQHASIWSWSHFIQCIKNTDKRIRIAHISVSHPYPSKIANAISVSVVHPCCYLWIYLRTSSWLETAPSGISSPLFTVTRFSAAIWTPSTSLSQLLERTERSMIFLWSIRFFFLLAKIVFLLLLKHNHNWITSRA